MTAEQIVFILVALFTLVFGLLVVTSRNLVHAALWLVATLFGVAVTYGLLHANFLAVVQVVVYIGAIAILGLHVSAGVIYLLVVANRERTGFYDKRGSYEMVEIAGLYWHFVNLVWVFIFAFFYLW